MVAFNCFSLSPMLFTNFSTQTLQYIFNGSRRYPYAIVLCTQHPYDIWVFIFSVYGALNFLQAIIWFIFSLYAMVLRIMKFQRFFFRRRCIDFKMTIVASVPIMFVSCWQCMETVHVAHVKMICFIVGFIQRFKQPWQVLG